MKAVVNTAYGSADVLQLKDVDKPTFKDSEVLRDSAVCSSADKKRPSLRCAPPTAGLEVEAPVGSVTPNNPEIINGQEGVTE